MVSCRVIEFLVIIIMLRRPFVLESIDKTTISNLIGPKSSPKKKKKKVKKCRFLSVGLFGCFTVSIKVIFFILD